MVWLVLVLCSLTPATLWSMEIYKKGDISLNAGWWGQVWYQYVSDMDTNGDGKHDNNLNDFLIRRSYFYIKGNATPALSFFAHFAGDKLGMDEIHNDSSKGLGSGIALRDGWIAYKLIDNDLIIQVGRMYIPFTRNYGTTSTKSLLSTDLDWGQGGLRSGIFYPSNIGRDDAVTLWGNILQDKLQYRFMVGDGEEKNSKNPDDNLRFAGRLSYNFYDIETGWFNSGNYIGTKHILALGIGADYQDDLFVGEEKDRYFAWTVDLHYDKPFDNGDNLTLDASFIRVLHSANGITWTYFSGGDDGDLLSAKAGYFFGDTVGPGNFQPFAQIQNINPDGDGKHSTSIYGLGLNYFIKGAANKLTFEATYLDQDKEVKNSIENHTLITFQLACGF